MLPARTAKELDHLLQRIRAKFSRHIKDYDTISTIDEFKWDFMYDLIEAKPPK